MTDRHQVELSLMLMRGAAKDRFVLRGRQKNRETFAMLGITREEVWVFGTRVRDSEIHVKVAVVTDPCACVCLSFHIAEKALGYPFRRKEAEPR